MLNLVQFDSNNNNNNNNNSALTMNSVGSAGMHNEASLIIFNTVHCRAGSA